MLCMYIEYGTCGIDMDQPVPIMPCAQRVLFRDAAAGLLEAAKWFDQHAASPSERRTRTCELAMRWSAWTNCDARLRTKMSIDWVRKQW